MAILVQDSFNRANSNTSLGVADTGQTYEIIKDSSYAVIGGIIDNQAYFYDVAGSGNQYHFAVVNTGISSYSVQIQFNAMVTGTSIAFRVLDGLNYFVVRFNSGKYELYKRVSGTWTLLGTHNTVANGDTVKVKNYDSGLIEVFINGTLQISVNDSSLLTYTKCGFGGYATTNESSRYDNFLVEDFTAGGGQTFTASLSDSVTFSETLTKQFTGFKSLSDNVINTDNLSKQYTGFKSFADNITSTDTISKQLSVVVIDTVVTSETETEQSNKQLTDTIASTDTLSKRLEKAIQDSVGTGDELIQQGGNSANLAEYITITDTISKDLIKYQYDNVNASEVDNETVTKALLDSLTQSDAITTTQGKVIVLSDSLTIVDSLSKAVSRLQFDSVGLSDIFTKQSTVSVRLYDVIITTDDISLFNPNAPSLIGTIKLEGKQVLNVYLQGKQELNVSLKGVIN